MKRIIIAAAAATIALTGVAMAQVTAQEPAIQGTAQDYGEPPNGANITTTQPSGGYAEDTLQAPTGNLSTGASNGRRMTPTAMWMKPMAPNRDGDNSRR